MLILRLLCVLLGFLGLGIALFTFLKAPHIQVWPLAIVATEFGLFMAAISFGIVLALFFSGDPFRWLALVPMAAVLLFVSPTIRSLPFRQSFQDHSDRLPPNHGGQLIETNHTFVTYGDEPGLLLTLSRPSNVKNPPCILQVHSGSWRGGIRDEFRGFTRRLVSAGYAIASIDYRLAPEHKWPAQRDDTIAAIDFLNRESSTLGIDMSQLVMFGRSAGGQIALASAYAMPKGSVKGVIAFYAPADMIFAHKYARSDDILDSFTLLEDYLGGTPIEEPEAYQTASGYYLTTKDSPPTLLMHGTRDELVWVRQSRRLSQRLTELGSDVRFIELPWATHAFDFNPSGPGGSIAFEEVTQFLNRVLKKSDATTSVQEDQAP